MQAETTKEKATEAKREIAAGEELRTDFTMRENHFTKQHLHDFLWGGESQLELFGYDVIHKTISVGRMK